MKKLLLTVAVASLALSSNAFAQARNSGAKGEGKNRETRTQEQKAQDALKGFQAPKAGTSRNLETAEAKAATFLKEAGVYSRLNAAEQTAVSKATAIALNSQIVMTGVKSANAQKNRAGTTLKELLGELALAGKLNENSITLKVLEKQIFPEMEPTDVLSANQLQTIPVYLENLSQGIRTANNARQSVNEMAVNENALMAHTGKTREEVRGVICDCTGACKVK